MRIRKEAILTGLLLSSIVLRTPAVLAFTLKECQEIAISRHRPTRIAKEKLKVAEAKLREAQRAFLPTLSAKFEDGRGELSGGKFERRSYGLESEFYLSKGGETKAKHDQARVRVEIAKKEYQKVKQDLEFEVARSYYRAAKAKWDKQIKDELQNKTNAILELAQKGHKEGAIPLRDLMAATARCEQIGFQKAQSRDEVAMAELALRHALNMRPDEELDIDYEIKPRGADITMEDCLTLAFKNRPEVSIDKYEVDYAKQTKKIARAKGFPWVVIVGTAGRGAEVWKYEDMELKDEWSLLGKVSWSFGGSTAEYSYSAQKQIPVLSTVRSLEYAGHTVKFSFLDNLKYFSDKAEAEVEYQKALDELETIFERVAYEAGESYYATKGAFLKVDAAKSQVEYRKLDLEIAQAMKDMGKISMPDLLESYEELAKAQSAYKEALAESNVAFAKLERAIGTTLESSEAHED